MTDLEMTRLCAKAMELRCREIGNPFSDRDETLLMICARPSSNDSLYDPLDNDEQAMALVKRFKLILIFNRQELWMAQTEADWTRSHAADLNRAVVECVAKMQAAALPQLGGDS